MKTNDYIKASGYKIKEFKIIFFALIIGIAIVGCEKKAAPVRSEKITIADASQPIGGLIYVAVKKNFFKEEGLDITLQPYTSGKSALNAGLLTGKADLATTAETPIMHAAMSGKKIFIISTIATSTKNMAIIGLKDKGILSSGSIKGKKIGVTLGTNGEFFLDAFLTANGITKSEVEVVNIKPEDTFNALISGSVDAVSTWNPHISRIDKALGDKVMIFYNEIIYTFTWNLVGTQEYVFNNKGIIKKVIKGLIKAENYVREKPAESKETIAGFLKIDLASMEEQWNDYNFEVTLKQFFIVGIEDQTRWAIRNKLVTGTEVPNYLDYIYMDALVAVKPQAVTIIR